MESKILIVDDEPLVLEMFETVLREAGYITISASNTSEAKNLLMSECFDLIIVDVWLDGDDGFILAQYAKKVQNNIEVIVITGRPSEKGSIDAAKNDFEYLSKPVPFGDLILAIQKRVEKEEKIHTQHLLREASSVAKLQ